MLQRYNTVSAKFQIIRDLRIKFLKSAPTLDSAAMDASAIFKATILWGFPVSVWEMAQRQLVME
jgi:hypothetical protein